MISLITLTVLAAVVQATPPARGLDDVRKLSFSSPVSTRQLSGDLFRGAPTRFCPSPDGTQAYVRFSERDRWGNETVRQALVTLRGSGVVAVDGEPGWAAECWSVKAAPEAPGLPSFAIAVDKRNETMRTTNVPREGAIGMNVSDPYATPDEVVGNAILSQQQVYVETFKLHGKVVATAINRHVLPGERFGWAPAPHALLAYVDEKERLVVMDPSGRIREVGGTRRVLLPVWGAGAKTLIFLERRKSGFELRTVDVRW